MSREQGPRIFKLIAIFVGVFVLATAAFFVVWFTIAANVTCDACAPAEAGDLAAVRAALDGQADAPARAIQATRALDAALTGFETYGRLEPDRRAIVLALLDAGADPDDSTSVGSSGSRGSSGASRSGGTSRLHYAAERVVEANDAELLERFITAGLNVKGPPGGAALTAAAAEGHMDMLQRLIALGADVNFAHGAWGSPLGAAVHNRRRAIADALDRQGAREW
jgi:hypothetical protein